MKRAALLSLATAFAMALALAQHSSALNKQPAPKPGAEAAQTAKPFDDKWPKDVATFLEGHYLDRADVVLTRRTGDITAAVIRWATNSPFSHAALVFTGPQFDSGISGTFVIEAGTGGVDLTQFTDYAENKSTFVAIKRLRKDWFTAPRQSRVRGLLLDKIKARYDFLAILHIARNIWFGVQSKVRTKEKTVEVYRENDWQPPNEYICSGLVQVGFVEMMIEAIKRGELSPEMLREVVFHKGAESRLPPPGTWQYLGDDAKSTAINFRDVLSDELYSATPEDLAQSDKLEWQYFIKNGLVYKVSSYADVMKLIQMQ
ncbi:MAG TPA: hypothetical protein PKD49_06890 [Hyphomicrobium sp.]|nr:hypothetical protein [Hyphomicrobium sp.]